MRLTIVIIKKVVIKEKFLSTLAELLKWHEKSKYYQKLIKLCYIIKGLKLGECILIIICLQVNLKDFRYTHNIYYNISTK